jgi:hypothetical protein
MFWALAIAFISVIRIKFTMKRIEADAFAVLSFETIVIPSQGDVLGLDARLACTMSFCAPALLRK